MDQRRALERAQAQFSEGDSSSGLPLNVLGMQGMSPDQLASLSSAHGGGGSFMGSGPQLEETDAVGTDATGTSGSLTPGFGSGLSAGLAAGTLGLESIPNPSYATSEDAASSEAATPDVSSSRQSTSPRRNNGLANREPLLLRHRPNPYADVPSLYDLYSQYSERTQKL